MGSLRGGLVLGCLVVSSLFCGVADWRLVFGFGLGCLEVVVVVICC